MNTELQTSIYQSLAGFFSEYDHAILIYFILINLSLFTLFFISFRSVKNFVKFIFNLDYIKINESQLSPPVSILIPAFNEELTAVKTIRSILSVNYNEFEIIVINDGSSDNTLSILIEEFALFPCAIPFKKTIETKKILGTYRSTQYANIIVIDKENGGKADALNAGINISKYPLFSSIDADCILDPLALLRIVKPFVDYPQETIAAGGIVCVSNGCEIKNGKIERIGLPNNMLAMMQVIEYFRAFLAGRAGLSFIKSILIISGAFSLFKKQAVLDIGGYSNLTDAEDCEIILRLHRSMREKKKKYRILFVADPVCWTEVPEKLKSFNAQRARWHRGLTQAIWLHKDMILNPRYGVVGLFSIPWHILFELIAPAIELLGLVLLFILWFFDAINTNFFYIFIFFSVFLAILLSFLSIALEEIVFHRYRRWQDLLRLFFYCFIENLGFRQYSDIFKAKGIFQAFTSQRRWGDMNRRG